MKYNSRERNHHFLTKYSVIKSICICILFSAQGNVTDLFTLASMSPSLFHAIHKVNLSKLKGLMLLESDYEFYKTMV